MSEKSKIQWTDMTWNPTAGCSKISPGCKNCYAIKDAVRLSGNDNPKISEKYAGTVNANNWTGKINLASDDTLLKPFRQTKPQRIFVNSMSDLFHENIPFDWIDKVFAVMALSPQHTFQILTKRAERMKEYFDSFYQFPALFRGERLAEWLLHIFGRKIGDEKISQVIKSNFRNGLPNVLMGVSVENQEQADKRIPLLLETPAKIRFLSCEPLLEAVKIPEYSLHGQCGHPCDELLEDGSCKCTHLENWMPFINWVIIGGESGHGARPCNIEWIRSIVQQCQSAGTKAFVKQLGAWAYEGKHWNQKLLPLRVTQNGKKSFPFLNLQDKKGGNIDEFPEDLKVREFPKL